MIYTSLTLAASSFALNHFKIFKSSLNELSSETADLMNSLPFSSSKIIVVSNHCMKIRIFVLQKCVKSTEKIIFSLFFVCFLFTEISYFLNFPSNENIRKQHLSANAYSCVNMKFSYTIAVRKDEIFCVVLLRKQAIFHLSLGQLFIDDI